LTYTLLDIEPAAKGARPSPLGENLESTGKYYLIKGHTGDEHLELLHFQKFILSFVLVFTIS
jgi:hypothetical protein